MECGGFFADEADELVYRFGDFLVHAAQTQAVIAGVMNNVSDYRIYYGELMIDDDFDVHRLDLAKYDVSERMGLLPHEQLYIVRVQESDDLLLLSYVNHRLTRVEVHVQC